VPEVGKALLAATSCWAVQSEVRVHFSQEGFRNFQDGLTLLRLATSGVRQVDAEWAFDQRQPRATPCELTFEDRLPGFP